MKTPRISHGPIVVTTLAAAIAAVGGNSAAAQSAPAPGYSLLWNDEFNGSSLDRGAWCTRYAQGGGEAPEYDDPQCTGPEGKGGSGDFLKDERQRYRDHNADGEALHVVRDGYLSLRATETRDDSYASFESAMVRSKLELRPSADESYYITSRLRLPDVQGSFAALWLVGGYGDNGQLDWPPEIDILEAALNGVEDTAEMVRVGVAVKGQQTDSGKEEYTHQGPRFDSEWNNFKADSSLRDVWLDIAHEWTTEGVCTYLNGELVVCEKYRWVNNDGDLANKAHVIFNLAVGGDWAGRHGVDGSTPMHMDIDYVRVFKKNGDVGGSPEPSTPVTSREPPTSAEPSRDGSSSSPEDPWYSSWYFWR